MAKQTINIGTAANSKNGDPLRTAFTKTNANFTELYNRTQFTHVTLTNHALDDKYFVVGSEVSFEHTDGGTEVDVIDTGLSITRGVIRGLYNPEEEEGYDTSSSHVSPIGTEWNNEGWYDLENVANRTFTTWTNIVQTLNGPPSSIGKELVMHDTINDKYYAIKFSKWSIGDNGGQGGFAYTRKLIDVTGFFTHTANGDEVDVIDTGLSITRASNQGIYNPEEEEGYNTDTYASPVGTLWNADGWSDLSDLEDRLYIPWRAAVLANPPSSVGKELVMKDTVNNKYYAIRFLEWGQDNGGSFRYHRRLINKDQINEGVKFADGSVLSSFNDVIDIPRTHDGIRTGGGVKYLDMTDRGRFIHYRGEDGYSDLYVPSHYENPLPVGFAVTIVVDQFDGNRVNIYSNNDQVTIIASGQSIFNTRYWYIGGAGNAGVYTLLKIEPNRWVLTGPEITFND